MIGGVLEISVGGNVWGVLGVCGVLTHVWVALKHVWGDNTCLGVVT